MHRAITGFVGLISSAAMLMMLYQQERIDELHRANETLREVVVSQAMKNDELRAENAALHRQQDAYMKDVEMLQEANKQKDEEIRTLRDRAANALLP